MAILGAGPTTYRRLVTQRPVASQPEGTTWLLGVAVDASSLRRAAADELAGARWGWVRGHATGRQRRTEPVETLLWVEQAVTVNATPVAGDLTRAYALAATPLQRLPFRVVVTPDAVVLRWDRSLGGDRDAQLLVQRLVTASVRRRPAAA